MSKVKRKILRRKKTKAQNDAGLLNDELVQGPLRNKLISPASVYKSDFAEKELITTYEGLTLRERNMIILEAATNIFNLTVSNWDNIRKTISSEQIVELYSVVADLWQPQIDFLSVLPAPSNELRALFLGDIDPEFLSRNIFRFTLYADVIYVVDPFHNPNLLVDEYNPLVNPGRFKQNTLKILYFLLQIGQWIRKGLVVLIPNPGDFDKELREQSVKISRNRNKNITFSKAEKEQISRAGKDSTRRIIYNLPREVLLERLREEFPLVSSENLERELDDLEKVRDNDPLALNQPLIENTDQFISGRAGLNLVTTLYLSEFIDAFPYTDLKLRWRDLLSARNQLPKEAQLWSPLTKGFQELDFNFLNNVDAKFAYEMRDGGRLESFRTFLRKMWGTLNQEEDLKSIENTAKEFRDEEFDEYRKAEADWEKIDTYFVSFVKSASLTGGGLGILAAIVTGGFSLVPPAVVAPAVVAGIFQLYENYRKRKEFRLKVPMSVFIEPVCNKK